MLLSPGLCDAKSGSADAKKKTPIPKGSVLKVEKVSVSNPEFAEEYTIHASTELGELLYSPHNLEPTLEWLDGSPVEVADLRRGIFYYPSLMLYWPVFPIELLTIIKK